MTIYLMEIFDFVYGRFFYPISRYSVYTVDRIKNVAVGFSILFQRLIYAAAFKSSLSPIGTRLAEPAGVNEILFGDLFR
jgi:hypothetical protein